MIDTATDLIRKLEEAAFALRNLAIRVRKGAPSVSDPALRHEMLESADGMERRAENMAAAIQRWRREIN